MQGRLAAATLAAAGCALPGAARADAWQVRATVGNDAFNGVLSHPDDAGFTSDLALAIRHARGDRAIGGAVVDRMITSTKNKLRCDLVTVVSTLAWTPLPWLEADLHAGVAFAGDLGGYWIQSRWHRLTGTGPRDPRELQDVYPGGVRAGGLGGFHLEASDGGPLRPYAKLDGQLAVGGTGVSLFETAAGLDASLHLGPVEVGIYGELALGRYHVEDPRLAMPGGYRPGWQVDRRLGVYAGVGRYRLSFEYRTNETSSGEPFSLLAFERR